MKRLSFSGCVVVAALALAALPRPCPAQSVPAERPRARPPSMLTGRAQWEKGADLFKRIKVPPAPPLAPEEALKTFRLAPGYRLELVAAEPMVQNPIFFEFDPAGRIWVVEYQGYMRDIKGSGEGDPICRLVVLEDTDGDGRADTSTVFLDQLVMPRSFAFVKGGLLLQEPPKLWFCADTDGDLRCDQRREVGRLGVAGNPQHTANGLRYGIDNWLHNADATTRHRWVDGALVEEATAHRGQFGVSFDETGRFLTCHESSALHADLIPAEYLGRNRNLASIAARSGRGFAGVDTNIATEAQHVYPIRVTPGITLGALELRDDGRLRTYTIVSGSCYYDGDQFPEDARGNVFVPEGGGNLIGRLKLTSGIRPRATRFYPEEQEFLASTDERFRPVNARVGPDGALYIADMYRGIIEHVIFMVPWIGDQVRDRQLHTGQDMGRIYRVVREDRPLDRRPPNLASASVAGLVGHLSDATGWWRLTAQRLLVERRDPAAAPLLKDLARHGRNALGRLHALWTLDGLAALDVDTKFAAFADADERVRAAAIRLCERGLDANQQAALLAKLAQVAEDRSEVVRLQATLTASGLLQPAALPLLARLARSSADLLFRAAALTGLQDRELEFVRLLLAESRERKSAADHERRLVGLAAQCVLETADAARTAALLDTLGEVSGSPPWQRDALFDAMASFASNRRRGLKPISLGREPAVLIKLARGSDPSLQQDAYRVMELFTWPGAGALVGTNPAATPLSPAQQERLEAGREAFTLYCAPCHQPHGGGAPNLAPPLAGSEWVTGPPERIVRIVLHGLYGPVQVNDQIWNLNMPGLGAAGALDDEKIAAVLSYIRRAWGNAGSFVEPQLVASIRRESDGRTLPWTTVELAAIAGAIVPAVTAAAAPIVPLPSGEILLPAGKAIVYAQRLGYRPALDVLAPWTVAEDLAEWRVELPMEGAFDVWVNLAADDDSAGDFFAIETEGSRTRGEVRSTGDYDHFREQAAGRLTLRAGVNRILMRPDGPLKRELADVRGLRLTPVAAP
ncbi:MAG: c-type cytochrome [Verrucomicrobia bacterium]|nr:c-type cytochrome [Verrucomicrobiota bacterium]